MLEEPHVRTFPVPQKGGWCFSRKKSSAAVIHPSVFSVTIQAAPNSVWSVSHALPRRSLCCFSLRNAAPSSRATHAFAGEPLFSFGTSALTFLLPLIFIRQVPPHWLSSSVTSATLTSSPIALSFRRTCSSVASIRWQTSAVWSLGCS